VAGLAGFASGVLASEAFGSATGVLAVAASGFALDLALDFEFGWIWVRVWTSLPALDLRVRFAIALIDTSTCGGKCS